MDWVIVLVVGYLAGSFSSAYFLGKIFLKRDMSREGSGNLGAANSLSTIGPWFGAMVFVGDFLKGGLVLYWVKSTFINPDLLFIAAIAVVLGHNFSLYLRFRGGKGLASMIGVLTILNPMVLLIVFVIIVSFFIISRHTGISAIITAISFPLVYSLVTGDWLSLAYTTTLSFLVIIKHRPEEFRALKDFFQN